MTKDEAVAALEALPEVERIALARLKPTDVLVLECIDYVSQAQAMRMRAQLENIWPDNKVLVLEHGCTLKVVSGVDLAAGPDVHAFTSAKDA